MDELDEFNEAPHSLRSESSSFHEMPPDDMERIDLDDDDDDDDDQNQIINILDRTVPGQISSTDLMSDDTTTTTTIIHQGDNLMFDDVTPATHSIYNSNGGVHKQHHSNHTILDTNNHNTFNNHSSFSKSDILANSANGGAIGDVLILANKSKPQHFSNHSQNA